MAGGLLLIACLIAGWIIYVITVWASAARWKVICIFLAGLLGAFCLGWLAGWGFRLQVNWDSGLRYRTQFRELAERFESGTLAVPAVSGTEYRFFPWLFCGIVLLALVVLAFLFLNRRRGLLIPVLLLPFLLCGTLIFERLRFWKEFLEMRKEQRLVHIAEAALQAQEKGVPKRLISAVFAEQSSLFRFSYERPDDAFSSGDAAYSALRALPDRMEIQQAKEVLKYAECLYSSPECPEIKAVRLLMADARRNGPDELERLFQTTGTVAGALYVRILFSRLEPQGKRVFPVLNGEVKLERNGVIETVPAKIFFSSRDRFREALLSAWFSGE